MKQQTQFITSLIITRKRDKTEIIEKTEKIFNVGQKVRLLNNKKLFDKLQTKYNDKVYTIVKVNKNTLDIEDENILIKNVKKYNVKVIDNYIKKEVIEKEIPTRKQTEQKYKQKKLLIKEDVIPENIIETKRIKKPNSKYI